MSDGGSVWLDLAEEKDGQIQRKICPTEPQVIQEYGKFGYLEGRFTIETPHFTGKFYNIHLLTFVEINIRNYHFNIYDIY